MIMQDWLTQRAARSPELVALIFGAQTWTFAQLDARVTGLAHILADLGVGHGVLVALLMGNSDGFVVLVHSIARLGAVLVPINTRLPANEIAWQLKHLDAGVLICDQAHDDTAQELVEQVPSLRIINFDTLPKTDLSVSAFAFHTEFDLDAPHSILFTSGTTGKPKGAVLTYGNHWWNAMGSALNLGLREDDVWLACMPLFHVGGLAILLRSVIYGIPVVLHETFAADVVNRALDEQNSFEGQRVTIVSLVSTMLRRVIDARGDVPFPASLRCVLLGGGPAPKELLEECAARHVPVVQTYGLTEAASQVATLAPADTLRKLGSAGKPLMGVELKIETDAEKGNVGEILIRGATVMREYYKDSEATARAFREGWFHTGDLGYEDDEGFLYVLSRRDDLIVSGGENIYPAEIEAVLNAHPAVLESAAVGVADAKWVQVPLAYVVLRAGQSIGAAELKAYCAAQLARYKIPAQIVIVKALPRNAAGKILRRVLV